MKYFKFNELKPGSKVVLQLPGENPINGKVLNPEYKCFFIAYEGDVFDCGNRVFFNKCGISNPREFCKNRKINGSLLGAFPEVDSIEELYKVLQLIENYYDFNGTNYAYVQKMSKDLLNKIDRINKETQALYKKYIDYISELWKKLEVSQPIDLYNPSFTYDEEMQEIRSKKINRNNTIYTVKSIGWIEKQDCVFIELRDDKSHFGLKLYRNRENVSMSDVMLLTYVFDMISYLLTEYSCKSVWVKK
nr:MAG TPA: hypothetical protein [Bacteriophage sp.]